jgi:hypothetical protein
MGKALSLGASCIRACLKKLLLESASKVFADSMKHESGFLSAAFFFLFEPSRYLSVPIPFRFFRNVFVFFS